MSSYKEGGYDPKYIISKKNGDPIDEDADYFVLRLDKDPHAIMALVTYARSVEQDNVQLATDLAAKIKEHQQILLDYLPKKIKPGEAKCYQCIHKRTVPGDAHISCAKPDSHVKGDLYGIQQGWFYYPVLFDPIWMIIECRNFELNDKL